MRRAVTEKLKHWLRVLLHTQDSPQRTAFAFSVGVFIAFLPPVPWFHTLFALMIAFLFRLNRLAVLAGTYTNTPITILPLIWAEIRVGKVFLGGTLPRRPPRLPHSAEGWREAFVKLRPFVPPLILGSILLGLIGAGIAYIIALRVIIVTRRRRELAAAAAAGEVPVPLEPPISVRPTVDTPENPS